MKITFNELRGLYGKNIQNEDVEAFIAKANLKVPKPNDGQQYLQCKALGFCLLFQPREGLEGGRTIKRRILTTVFLYKEGVDKYHSFSELPFQFDLNLRRAELLKRVGPPQTTFKVGEGLVSAEHPDPTHDTWVIDDLSVTLRYATNEPRYLQLTPVELKR
jgi:hypothetical protein